MTPLKSKSLDIAEVKRVCQDCTLAGFKAIYEAGPARPFRFLYFSGEGVMDDPTAKKPLFLGDFMIIRVSICARLYNPSVRFPLITGFFGL